MSNWVDYYKILQVHYLAEPEVIESAYRRLSKKYHPDVCKEKDALQRMVLINRAYEVLGDESSRREYLLKWAEHNRPLDSDGEEISIDPSSGILDRFMEYILTKEYSKAYKLLDWRDRANVSRGEFSKWQQKATKVFELKGFECHPVRIHKDVVVDGRSYSALIEFSVKISEYNSVMQRLERDEFTKWAALDEVQGWGVLLGHKSLSRLMERFDELASLKTSSFAQRRRLKRKANEDLPSGLLNIKGFEEKARSEEIRRKRYGSKYSLMLIEVDGGSNWRDLRFRAARALGDMLKDRLRTLDIACRWKGRKFIVLLPETDQRGAKSVAIKLKALKQDSFSISVVVGEQRFDSLDELIERLDSVLSNARARGELGQIYSLRSLGGSS